MRNLVLACALGGCFTVVFAMAMTAAIGSHHKAIVVLKQTRTEPVQNFRPPHLESPEPSFCYERVGKHCVWRA
jgi:hypothetical protein